MSVISPAHDLLEGIEGKHTEYANDINVSFVSHNEKGHYFMNKAHVCR